MDNTNIICLSISHNSHDLQSLASMPQQEEVYSNFEAVEPIKSFFYLNTCNRSELYLEVTNKKNLFSLIKLASKKLEAFLDSTPQYLIGEQSIFHMFKTISGLNSMALGETQITGQFKRAFELATQKNCISNEFSKLFSKALHCQKRIRTETNTGEAPISLFTLLEAEINERSEQTNLYNSILLGGTGDMSQKILTHFKNLGCKNFTVIRHSLTDDLPPAFVSIAPSLNIELTTWDKLKKRILRKNNTPCYDLMISSANSKAPLLEREHFNLMFDNNYLKKGAYLIDFAIPNNFETGQYQDRLVNLEDLLSRSKENLALRQEQVSQALPIIQKIIGELYLEQTFKEHRKKLNETLFKLDERRKTEWNKLLDGPLKSVNAKQKRILQDYVKKQEQRAIKAHKEIFAEILSRKNLEGDLEHS